MTQKHKGSWHHCHLPLQGLPGTETRYKSLISQRSRAADSTVGVLHPHTAHEDTQLSSQPTPRADARQDSGAPTEQNSECSYVRQQPTSSYYLSYSPSCPTPNPVVGLTEKQGLLLHKDGYWSLIFRGQLWKPTAPNRLAGWLSPLYALRLLLRRTHCMDTTGLPRSPSHKDRGLPLSTLFTLLQTELQHRKPFQLL